MLPYIIISIGAFEITPQIFSKFEGTEDFNEMDFDHHPLCQVNDILYIKSTAWKSSTYSQKAWPYSTSMDSSYFQAVVTKTVGSKGASLSFSAFELEEKRHYSGSWLKKYSVSVLPEGCAIITKDLYEQHEVMGNGDSEDEGNSLGYCYFKTDLVFLARCEADPAMSDCSYDEFNSETDAQTTNRRTRYKLDN